MSVQNPVTSEHMRHPVPIGFAAVWTVKAFSSYSLGYHCISLAELIQEPAAAVPWFTIMCDAQILGKAKNIKIKRV